MPAAQAGLAYLKDGAPVEPDTSKVDLYQTLAGSRRGHWPSSSQIAGAMLERKPPGS